MRKTKVGVVDYSALNQKPEKHELATARYFARLGHNVVFLKPSNTKGVNNPDFMMNGKIWETKSPVGKSRRTFEDDFRKAIKQSENIIIDLRRKSLNDQQWCIAKLKLQSKTPKIKTLLAITKNGDLLTLKGDFGNMESR